MDAFYGTWKVQLDKTTGVAEIGKLFGWNEEKMAAVTTMEYTLLIEKTADGSRCVVDYGVVRKEFSFKLGEPFDYTGVDGTNAKCTVVVDGGQLLENFKAAEGVTWKTVREINGANMKATTTFGGNEDVKCVQELIKV
ncbi:unnamed protein product [Lymnaea stagnalis]|uniref:Uncharacterized protein n=1 Tax=Lymnaea stagnalis TaxID=6523 RepID=A0AAV2IRG4_LYMST